MKQNSLEELIATTAYVDLFLRHITQPDLLYTFLKFICTESFDDVKLLSTLITRINGTSKVSCWLIYSNFEQFLQFEIPFLDSLELKDQKCKFLCKFRTSFLLDVFSVQVEWVTELKRERKKERNIFE